MSDAVIFKDEATANKALELADKQQVLLVGPYLAEVTIDTSGAPYPVHFREVFRSRGPSNHLEHGKQAET